MYTVTLTDQESDLLVEIFQSLFDMLDRNNGTNDVLLGLLDELQHRILCLKEYDMQFKVEKGYV